ncbi:MAG: toprim domain-containing protein, partial [Acetobacteraceae bacterium]|nr:toprim domain-containing protein [Acetobacteraceae bacterium]
EAQPAQGSLVEAYLASRGLAVPDGAPIRFHPACPRGAVRWPAMMALMTDPLTGRPCGVHRTFLARDGSGKAPGPLPAKMMLGNAGIIRLTPDEEVTAGLGIAEGIETALSVMQGFGWRPVWTATSAGAIRTFPILRGIEALTVFADADGAGMEAATACCARWQGAGREARIVAPPAGADFNDLIRKGAAA